MKYLILILTMLAACGEAPRSQFVMSFESEERRSEVDLDEMHYLARSLAFEAELWGGYDADESYEAILQRDVIFVDYPFDWADTDCENGETFCRHGDGGFGVHADGTLLGLYKSSHLTVISILWPHACLGYSSIAHEWLHVLLRYHGEREYSNNHEPDTLWVDVLDAVDAEFAEVFCQEYEQ